jgi:uncharacterized Tic20 family protein
MVEKKADQSKTFGMLCHLTALSIFIGIPFGNIIGPLVIWLMKKDEYPLVDKEGKASLNFQISMTIYIIIAALLCFIIIGFIILPVVLVADLVLVIIASVKISNGEEFQYPFAIEFIR